MTKTEAIKIIKNMPGMTARTAGDNEIRITYTFGTQEQVESAAYYTDCPNDAIASAQHMSNVYVEDGEDIFIC